MHPFNEYIAARADAPDKETLHRLVARHEWFTTARRARSLVLGTVDPALVLPLAFWPTVPPVVSATPAPAASPCAEPADLAEPAMPAPTENRDINVIDRFIEHGGYRIVPDDDAGNVNVDVEVNIDPEMVTEELAEIYRAQGLHDAADKIYTILLRNS